jgi:HSP90 family molecular chaperone
MNQVSDLRKQLRESSIKEERVEVNQRHLIDKILARYSSEYTVYRELIQNANDAGAKQIKITFNVDSISKKCFSVSVENNGRALSEEDWKRLKRIAEGNPDEHKIGFFGVGFYAVFSFCEEPL